MSCTVDVVYSILAADRGLNVEIDCASCIKDFAARESATCKGKAPTLPRLYYVVLQYYMRERMLVEEGPRRANI